MQHLEMILTFLGGGALGTFFAFIMKILKFKKISNDDLLANVWVQLGKNEQRNDQLEKEIDKLREERKESDQEKLELKEENMKLHIQFEELKKDYEEMKLINDELKRKIDILMEQLMQQK
jgi:septal ring factor EnvC (AmiA/AmiB activator)